MVTNRSFGRVWIRLFVWCLAAAGLVVPLAVRADDPPAVTPTPASPSAPIAPSKPGFSVPAFRKASRVVVIPIDGGIDGFMAFSVTRRIADATKSGADAIVFDINSPGGEVPEIIRICTAIKQSSVPNTVAWINPAAWSGGAMVALACREIVVNDPASFGCSQPIMGSPIPFLGAQGIKDPELIKKFLPVVINELQDSARRHNEYFKEYRRDEYLSKALAANDVALWLVRHKQTGVQVCVDRDEFKALFPDEPMTGPAQLATATVGSSGDPSVKGNAEAGIPAGSRKMAMVADKVNANQQISTTMRPRLTAADRDQWELVEKATDGTSTPVLSAENMLRYRFANNPTRAEGGVEKLVPIRTDEDLKEFFGATTLHRMNASWSEGLVVILTNIFVRAVLLVIFLVSLFVEMSHPGALLPGGIAAIALVLLLGPPMLVGMAAWWEIGAILLGIVLVALEIFVIPGFGIVGIVGLILLFVGMVATFTRNSGVFPDSAADRADLLKGATTVLLSMITAGVTMYFVAKHFGSIPLLNRFILKTTGPDDEEGGSMIVAMGEEEAPARLGDFGKALTPLRPAGRVQIDDRIVDAVAELGFIPAGAIVRVSSVTAFRVGVELVRDGEARPA